MESMEQRMRQMANNAINSEMGLKIAIIDELLCRLANDPNNLIQLSNEAAKSDGSVPIEIASISKGMDHSDDTDNNHIMVQQQMMN